MAPPKTTRFNLRWLDKVTYPQFAGWLSSVKGDIHSAYCTSCKSTFNLSNMGIGAIKCHAKGAEHQKLFAQALHNQSIASFFPSQCDINSSGTSTINVNSRSTVQPENTSSIKNKELSMQAFTTNDDTLKAEIIWAMTVVEKRFSLNSCTNISNLFKLMFTDSAIAQQFQLGKDKVSYFIHYGISTYFHEVLRDALKNCSDVTICFDESLNKVAQKGQMDLIARFWIEGKVCTRYYGSVFLGRATAQDLLDSFLKALDDVPLSKLLHVSMDGPNVNLSFLNKLEEHISNEYPDGKQLIKMGTCGLHIVHGSLKTGLKSVDWDIFSILRNLYFLFKDSPARRAEFTRITNCSVFPKKFCAVRWLENSDCIARAIEILESVIKYLSEVKIDSKVKTTLQTALKDPLLKCKLAFVRSLSLQCETFLTFFQSDQICVPYLYSELSNLLGGIIKRFVTPEKVGEGAALLKLDMNSKSVLLEPKNIDIGFGTKKVLKKIRVNEKSKDAFFYDCQKILINLTKKLIEKSPLKYKLVRGLSSLHPSIILNNSSVGLTRFKIILEILHNANRISEVVAEKAKNQFSSFCTAAKNCYNDQFKSLLSDESSLELDSFYYGLLAKEKKWEDLWLVVKLCLIISHGNASVERGFSVNKTILVENLKEQSLVNQRIVYDGIKSLGGVENIQIDKRMMLAVRGARQRYRRDLEDKKKYLDKQAVKVQEKRKLENELQQLQHMKKKIRLEREKEENELSEKIQMLEEQKKMLL